MPIIKYNKTQRKAYDKIYAKGYYAGHKKGRQELKDTLIRLKRKLQEVSYVTS